MPRRANHAPIALSPQSRLVTAAAAQSDGFASQNGAARRGQGDGPGALRVLVIDDNAIVLEGFRKTLANEVASSTAALDALGHSLFGKDAKPETPARAERPDFEVDLVAEGAQGWRRAVEAVSVGRPYAVAFVDLRMPGGWDGLQTIEALWRTDPCIQVVICTAYSEYSWDDITARLGRSDRLLVLRKPFETIEVLQLACTLSEKWSLHRERQARLDDLERRVAERTQRLQQALDEGKAYEENLHHQATHDALTGLPNRLLLADRAAQFIAQMKGSGLRLAMLFLDLDQFKIINDSWGHGVGDALLKAVALRLQVTVRDSDTVARLGGDEFVIILASLAQFKDADNVAQKVLAAFAEPFAVGDHQFFLTASIGVSVYPEDGDNSETLLKHADVAMYAAKEQGRHAVQFYTREMGVRVEERIALQNALCLALERQEFELHYQPQVDMKSGKVRGVEALVRWHRPEVGMVPPDRFIPLAEETGLILPIGEWVLKTACAQVKAWHAAGYPDLSMAVNVSACQFRQQNMPELVRAVLAETGLAARYLELELTESVLMQDKDAVVRALRQLKQIGVTLSLDDFGTGYSSLSYLKDFPIDVVKIDRSFVRDVTNSVEGASLTKAIIAMARSLNLTTVAEGVETEGQLSFLNTHRCDAIQGYYFSRPLPANDLVALLGAGKHLPVEYSRSEPVRRTLLLVDDDESILSTLDRLLRRDGFHILSTTSPRQALELLAIHPVGVIVCDARMPEMPGMELLRRVKGLYPDIVRIMLTGHSTVDSVTDAINDGAVYKFITKPWDDALLREKIAEAFRRHEMSSENDRPAREEADAATIELPGAAKQLSAESAP
ncbi:hypothetical protein ASC87_00595 [Rhizobacter sp. Root1221]|nr:hypothetical protein ASC87_00595 [Rhizobacter sp. Root1221]